MPLHSLGHRYEVGDMIGTGGMSDVYRATDTLLGREVAVKIMRADLARDESFRERFRREAQNGGGLNHPAIVAVYDTGDTDLHGVTVPYIVMELVRGRTLRAILREGGPIDPHEAAKVLVPVCEALQVSHNAGIIHRDIKPANIMITPTGDVKVMDFGIARALSDATSAMTATAAVIGTAQYLSPEQARGKVADARSDIYATGCVFYELLTGKPPFAGDSPLAIAYQHVQEDPTPPSENIPGLSPTVAVNVDAVCLTAIAKHPADRYQSASEFAEDLRRIERGSVAMAARSHLHTDPDPTPTPQHVAPPTAQHTAQHVAPPTAQHTAQHVAPPTAQHTAQHVAPPTAQHTAQHVAPATAQPAPQPFELPTRITEAMQMDSTTSQRAEKKSPWGIVVATLAVLALLGGGGFMAYSLMSKDETKSVQTENVTIPDVSNKLQAEATTQLIDLGLRVEAKQEPNPTVPKGQVVSTNPAAGSQIRSGATVTLVISSGKEIIEVPDVMNLTTEEAEKMITDAGLLLDREVKQQNSDTVEVGKILNQSPAAGAQVSKGSRVSITVSSGVEEIRVPSIDGMKWDQAQGNLTALGFVPQVHVVNSQLPEGTVISLAESGQKLPKGSAVTVTISNGAAISMPSLKGMTTGQAVRALRGAGWSGSESSLQQRRVPTTSLVEQGKIANQEPAAGQPLTKDALVYVDVYDFQLLPPAR